MLDSANKSNQINYSTECPACHMQSLNSVAMDIEGFKICSHCYCTVLPWSKLQTIKRKVMFVSRKKWAEALNNAPIVELKPSCLTHNTPLTLSKLKDYGTLEAWQHESSDNNKCEMIIVTPVVMAEIMAGSTQIREKFSSTKHRSKEKWNPLAFIGKLFSGGEDDNIDDLLEDIQFQRKIAPALGLKK